MNRALHISANTYPKLNDNEHHTKKIWKELAKGFDEYHIFARSQNNRSSYTIEGNIHLHLIPKIYTKSRIFIFSSFLMYFVIKKHKINYLLSQSALFGGISAAIYSKIFKIPLMVEIHGDIYFKFMKGLSMKDKIFSKLIRFSYNNATKIRSLSTKMSEDLIELGVLTQISLIPNRVNLELFKTNKKSFDLANPIKIVSVGRFVPQKGYDIAIQVIKELSKKYSIELFLIGGGKLHKEFQVKSKNYNNIHLISWIEQSELIKILSSSDIYIQPSKPFLGEAMPRTILEAMAMKLPIIASNIAAIPGILDNTNSILIKPNSVTSLKNSIEKLIDCQLLRESLGLKAYGDVSLKYEWSIIFQKFRNEIKNMEYGS